MLANFSEMTRDETDALVRRANEVLASRNQKRRLVQRGELLRFEDPDEVGKEVGLIQRCSIGRLVERFELRMTDNVTIAMAAVMIAAASPYTVGQFCAVGEIQ